MSPERPPARAIAAPLGSMLLGAALLTGVGSEGARAGAAAAASVPSGEALALRAGTVHLVEGGEVLRGGATVLVVDGRIQAVGADLEVPAHAQVIDYGDDAVLVPGFVAASSPYGGSWASDRTASPGTLGVDAFDSYGSYAVSLSGGVTSAYVAPAEDRLIAGIGALVKLGGEPGEGRVLLARAAVHGAVDASARRTPGFWEPPVPSTVDVGIGYLEPQLPRSTMGAIVALEELLEAARSDDADSAARRLAEDEYGRYATLELARALEQELPWCVSADEANEIRAILELARASGLSLIVDRAGAADRLAEELADAGASVIFRVPFQPNAAPRDPSRDRDARWPSFDVPAALVDAGVRVAIAAPSPSDLLFAAGLARAGGLSEADALRAITLGPAEMFGAAARVGSLAPGKDADLAVLNADPFAPGTSVLATWVGGELAWSATPAGEDAPVVLEVNELFVGDGRVLRPGQLLMRDGQILEVGERVSHPRGTRVVRGPAAMPGMIDALGHLGLEGSKKTPRLGSTLAEIVGPGDRVDRRVARRGITTVVMTPRGDEKSGVPVMAYKPASEGFEDQVLGDPVAVRLRWEAPNRLESGEDVRGLLAKAAAYAQAWDEYERAMASWTPPPPAPPKAESEDEEKDDESEEDEEDEDKEKSKKKRKKKGEPELEPDPITGLWHAPPPASDEEEGDGDDDKKKDDDEEEAEAPDTALKLRLLFEAAEGSGAVEGNLRCDAASESLVELEGYWDREERSLELRGLGSRGWVTLSAKPGETTLEGTLTVVGEELPFLAQRLSKEYVVARRAERRRPEPPPKVKDPKGKPKEPKLDPKLEPLRAAIAGEVSVVVGVDREDEILECVAAFGELGIRPVLLGGAEAHLVAEEIAGEVAGVLLSPRVRIRERDRGTNYLTPHAALQNAGVPVAFASGAEAGAIELPLIAAYAVANGMSPAGALRALTLDAAAMMSIDERVGALERGRDADVLLLDGPPLEPGTQVLRTWVNGTEVYGW